MTDEQQGFACDSHTELVQLNYIPIYSPSVARPLPNNLKPQGSLPSCLVPHSCASPSKYISQNAHKLIFNNPNRRAIIFQSQLLFESSFQSGNLEYVTRQDNEYHLFMRADTNTKGHYQWFYFSVKNKNKKKVQFVVKNFNKSSMLYTHGLTPFVRSKGSGDLEYRQLRSTVAFEEEEDQDQNVRYSLRFSYSFQNQNDQVQFCTQPPYTFKTLQNLLLKHQFRTIELSKTVMGHPVEALFLNDPKNSKALIVVIARQHPGQSVGSWMMQGYIDKLVTLTEKEKERSKDICWIIVPMVNIDGVMLGNNRTGLLGYDFNRHWNCDEDSLKEPLFPELAGIMKYFKKSRRQRNKRAKMFLDLHGHSSEPNVFTYGPPLSRQSEYYDKSRLFPYLMSKSNPAFNLSQCSYQIASQKRNCSRSIFFSRLGFPYSYTVESSFGIYNNKQINQIDMVKVGQNLCETSLDFVCALVNEQEEKALEQITAEMRKECGEEMSSHAKQYDSDSQGEDKLPSYSINLESKVASVLKHRKKSKIDGLYRKSTIKESHPEHWNLNEIKHTHCTNFSEPNIKKSKIPRERMKTDFAIKGLSARKKKEEVKFPYLSRQRLPADEGPQFRPSLVRSLRKIKAQEGECSLYKNQVCKQAKEFSSSTVMVKDELSAMILLLSFLILLLLSLLSPLLRLRYNLKIQHYKCILSP